MPRSKLIKFHNSIFSKRAFRNLIQLEFFSIEDATIFKEELINTVNQQEESIEIFFSIVRCTPGIQLYGKKNKLMFEYTESGEIEEDQIPEFCIQFFIEFSPGQVYKMIDLLERARSRVGARVLKCFNRLLGKPFYLVCLRFKYDKENLIDVERLDEED